MNLSRQGTVRLYLKFVAALARTVTVVAFAESDNKLEIRTSYSIAASHECGRYRSVCSKRRSLPPDVSERLQRRYSVERPRLPVCNTDPSDKPRKHWIAICVNSKKRGDYSGSFGQKPPGFLADYTSIGNWIRNARQLQSVISSYCGLLLLFLLRVKMERFRFDSHRQLVYEGYRF